MSRTITNDTSVISRGSIRTMIQSERRPASIIHAFRIVWFDPNLDEAHDDNWRDNTKQLRHMNITIDHFGDIDGCVQFIDDMNEQKLFLVITGYTGNYIMPSIHDKPQLDTIYVLCGNEAHHKTWTKNWPKIRGLFTDVSQLCSTLKAAVKKNDENNISIGLMPAVTDPSKQKLDQLDASFMYSIILKKIILDIEFDDSHLQEFITYCEEKTPDKADGRSIINEMKVNYGVEHTPVWWYIQQSFLYSMLNTALRNMDTEVIIKTAFYISDLHQQIEQLHHDQFNEHTDKQSFPVYRGLGLPIEDFNRMKRMERGLISFNSFLSTSKEPTVSVGFASEWIGDPQKIPVLFHITIDPQITFTPYALVSHLGPFPWEKEILFSMHSVFRIQKIQPLKNNSQIWEVTLTMIGDRDPELDALTTRIIEETKGYSGWHQLAHFLLQIAKYDQAETLTLSLLQDSSELTEKGLIYNLLGIIKNQQGHSPGNHPDLAISYSNIGQVYSNMGEYTKALSYYEKDLEITRIALPENHPDLATSYSNIGQVYSKMGEYTKALSYYEKSLVIRREALPENHPSLATSYSNIGQVYSKMGEYTKALSYYEKDLEITRIALPENHPDLAFSDRLLGEVYNRLGEYRKGLSLQEAALKILKEKYEENHVFLARSYGLIGESYACLGEFAKALPYFEKLIGIRKRSLSPEHPNLALGYSSIVEVYNKLGLYEKALSSVQNALQIQEKVLPENHPDLAFSYSSMGEVYFDMKDYSKAMLYHEKALRIREKSLHLTHPDVAVCYNNIGLVHTKIGEHEKALSYFQKAVDIRQQTLPENHPLLAVCFDNIGQVHQEMADYAKAHSFYERAIEIAQSKLPEEHPQLQIYKDHENYVKNRL